MHSRIGYILKEVTQGVIVHQVNAQGKMGSGIAKAIKEKWPIVEVFYQENVFPNQPDRGLRYMGHVFFVEVEPGLWVANLVGQQFYGREQRCYTSYEALEMGLHSVAKFASSRGLDVHYPTIGCGLGGGDWSIVSSLLDKHFDDIIVHTLWELPA